MNETSHTPIEKIPEIHSKLKATFRTRRTISIPWRQQQLLLVARMVQDNKDLFAEALFKDVGKPAMEAYSYEISPILERVIIAATNLPEWAKPEHKTDLFDPHQRAWSPKVYFVPKGVALVIVPWNFPLILAIQPLVAAISAGCCCAVKASEIAPHTGRLLAELVPKYLDTEAYQVILGAVPETTKILELKWDHIFYTGNGHVGRIVSAAAAKHLTPLTLELGGKSPVILDPSYDLDVAAYRIMYGKVTNCGQICVAPDYLIVPTNGNHDLLNKVVEAFRRAYASFFSDAPPLESTSYARIVSKNHFDRLNTLLARTDGTTVLGGQVDAKRLKIEPTVVIGIQPDDALMESELFGPILPIIEVGTFEDACELVSQRDHPLVLYAFTQSEDTKTTIRECTTSGNLVYNDTFIQLAIAELPFGGVGESGHGRQGGRYSFESFSYLRASIDMPLGSEQFLTVRYPPYTSENLKLLNPNVDIKIPQCSPTTGIMKG
ncbi:aldehyde dehydrogenase [Guyanagaster necrorhizus]|uniref:Aldehyde dehydrogenase n=1 Tax=Guyanagaster necrorhizus TaxID=856835 RepID=A0A9P7VPQ8_9AGAR|nr:aldehyde dehydrogenase [Guyanagaster necrorhizus MCA 3950]KAG7444342.1 aldehyde dehydrogenase [Guyanagaster necrorhizus MCA 3950]